MFLTFKQNIFLRKSIVNSASRNVIIKMSEIDKAIWNKF